MRKIAHIVHPVVVDESSDLLKSQPITFETMQTAREFAADKVEVQFYSAQYAEDKHIVPDNFITTPDLDRSIKDIGTFQHPRRLPLLKDILDRVYAAAGEAEYLIYTNVDIGLQPYFYTAVNQMIDQGVDAMIINRRTITDTFQEVEQIPLMYAELGKAHPGRDCFVFKREVYPRYSLGNVCIGFMRVGAVFALNLIYNSINFQEFRDLHLTFHLGERRSWRDDRFADYHAHNEGEWTRQLAYFRQRYPNVKSDLVDRMSRTEKEKGR